MSEGRLVLSGHSAWPVVLDTHGWNTLYAVYFLISVGTLINNHRATLGSNTSTYV